MDTEKIRKIIGWALVAYPLFSLTAASVGKLTRHPEIVEKFAKLNIPSVELFGIITLVSILFYLIPKTANLGFLLLCSYLGGVIVGELALGESPMPGIVLSVLLYAGTIVRKPALLGLAKWFK